MDFFLREESLWSSWINSPPSTHMFIDVFLDRTRRQIRGSQMLEKRAEQSRELLARRQIFFQTHPGARPNRSSPGNSVPGCSVAQWGCGLLW